MVVDSTGMLFDLYRIGTVAVVGGGHGSGLHNVLELASAGFPIVTGPELGGFREAHALQDLGALSAGDVADLTNAWLADARSCAQFGARPQVARKPAGCFGPNCGAGDDARAGWTVFLACAPAHPHLRPGWWNW